MKSGFGGLGRLAGAVVLAAALAGAGSAAAAGYSRRVAMGTNGVARVSFGGGNVWKPVSVAVVLEGAAARTVRIGRQAFGLSYVIAEVTGAGLSYVYMFDGVFWFSGTNALVVSVEPPAAGVVEVICE